MKTIRLLMLFVTIAIIGYGCSPITDQKANVISDPLREWNEGPAKASVLTFVKTVTDENNPDFIPSPERVAVFDMDCTFLLEKPFPVNFDVILKMLVEQMSRNPSLIQKQPYKAIHELNWTYFDTIGIYGENGLYSILRNTTKGYTEDCMSSNESSPLRYYLYD